jgi:uncharacterized YccA/Bax inhibitor family protein
MSANPILVRNIKAELSTGEHDSRPMSLQGTVEKSALQLAIVVAVAGISWITGIGIALFFPAMLVGLALGLWISFSKTIRKGAIVAYSIVEGVFIGGISAYLEMMFPGIVQTAVIATFATAGMMLLAYRQGWIKVTERFRRIMFVAVLGYLAFSLINLGYVLITDSGGAFSSQWGWLAGLLGAGLAALTLVLDFDLVDQGLEQAWPKAMEWRIAFGFTASLIWLYVEILRLLAIFRE